VLYQAAAAIRVIAYMIYPVLPDSANKIWEYLGEPTPPTSETYQDLAFNNYKLGQKIQKPPKPLFPRVGLKDFLEEKETESKKDVKEEKMDTISFQEFKRMDLRVGVILDAERVEGTDKLLKINVDIGNEHRQMVAGIAETYAPEDLIGKKLIVIVNLQPAVIRGVESQAMLLAAEMDGKAYIPFFVEDLPAGAKVL
jgi:methionyl-tRNA synthetase